MLVGHCQPADVVAVAALPGGEVDPSEHEAGVAELQGGEALGDVALDHLPLPAGLFGTALAHLDHRAQPSGLLARPFEAAIGAVDVGLFGGQVGMGRHHPPGTRGLAILQEVGGQRGHPPVGDAGPVTDAEGPYGTLIDTRVRVLSWNLWHRFGPWEARRPAIAATLARIDPDVVCLQEVWADQTVGFAAELAEGLGFHHVYGARLDVDGVRFGNAVLSRWPITASDVLALPSTETTEELRTCVRADIDGPRGALQVFSTHLNWRFDQSDVRQEQVRSSSLSWGAGSASAS